MSDLRKMVIDGVEHELDPNLTVLQACEVAGKEIPRFCYHERLSIAGNCRMCLIEAVGAPKPMASCAMQVKDLRGGPDGQPPEIKTNSALVKKAREGVMEFLLINHPLDCPICDQGGECDLQDQAMAYGADFSRFREAKRAMDEISLGPLIKTHMTRCIQCTRCVRFATEVAGVPEMGCTGRGEDAEIVSYLDAALTSEMQGNVIDLCPVGALTSRPYAFNARPWELRKTETIDVMDALGSNIRIDAKGTEVMRVMPQNHDGVNEEWISDKTRFACDGLARQRLDQPYVRKNGKLTPASWDEAFAAIREKVSGTAPEKIAALAGDLMSTEAMFALKVLMTQIGSQNLDCRQDGAKLPANNRAAWLFNSTIEEIEDADAILLIGTNPRKESPVLNARIRKAWLTGTEVGVIGEAADLTFDTHQIGTDGGALSSIKDSGFYKDVLSKAERPLVILGVGATARDDGAAVLGHAMALAESLGGQFSMLHTAAGRVGGMEVGCVPGQNEAGEQGRDTDGILVGAASGAVEVVYLLGADEIDMETLGAAFVVYQGHHGDAGAHRADVILPSAAYAEQSGIFVNMEGRPQMAFRAAFPPGEAKEDWAILRALSERLGEPLPFDTIEQLRAQMFEKHPHLQALNTITPAEWNAEPVGALESTPFVCPIDDFYLTNPIARASETMAACSALAQQKAAPMAAE